MPDEEQYEKDLAKEEERKQAEAALAEDAAALAEEEAAAEEEKLISNEQITYSSSIDGAEVILIVNFKTKIVSGSIKYSGDDGSIDAPITKGEINIDNFEIEAKFSGKRKNEDGDFPFVGTINGKISNDLSTFNGEFWDNETGFGGGFTATK